MFGDPNYLDLKDFTSLRHYATCIKYEDIQPVLGNLYTSILERPESKLIVIES